MATFYRTENGIGFLILAYETLAKQPQYKADFCDNCGEMLVGAGNIILIPAKARAYCHSCGKAMLPTIKETPLDTVIRTKTEKIMKEIFNIESEESYNVK